MKFERTDTKIDISNMNHYPLFLTMHGEFAIRAHYVYNFGNFIVQENTDIFYISVNITFY